VRKPRIGIDASAIVIARKNGYENYATRLLLSMASLEEAEFDSLDIHLYIYSGNRLADASLLRTYLPRLQRFPCRVFRPRRGFRVALPLWAMRDRLDWLHLPVHLWSQRLPVPVLSTFHDACSRRWLASGGEAYTEITQLEHLTSRQIAMSDAFIAVSASTKRDLIELLGVTSDRVHVVLHGADGSFVETPDRSDAIRAHYGLTSYILSVNALQGNKNYGRLIRAFGEMTRSGRTDRVLAIVGRDGWGAASIHTQIESAGVDLPVRYLGYVPQVDLPGLYAGADLVVNASLCEGFGFPILEALEAGAVVAASRSTSLPEVGGNGVAYFDPFDVNDMARVMERALTDTSYRIALRDAAQLRLADLTWEKAARSTLDVYRTIAARKKGGVS